MVDRVVFLQDGRLLASASEDGMIKLWDPTRGVALQTLRAGSGSIMAVIFSPDGKLTGVGIYSSYQNIRYTCVF